MRLIIHIICGLLCASFMAWCPHAWADGTINTLSPGTALTGPELIPMFQGSNPAVYTTPSAIATYASGLSPSTSYVVNTTSLRATSTASFPNGVLRLTDGVAGAPPLFFTPGTGACATDDGASCVNSSNSAHWSGQFPPGGRDIRQFGAVGDDTTDATAAIQAAINSLPATGGTIFFPNQTFKISSPGLFVGNGTGAALSTKQGVYLKGDGDPLITGGGWDNFTTVTAPKIDYRGGTGSAVFIDGPLEGWGISNLEVDCTNATGTVWGLDIRSGRLGKVSNFITDNCSVGIYSWTQDTTPPTVPEVDSLSNSYNNIVCLAGNNCMVLDGGSNGCNWDTTGNLITNITAMFPNSYSIIVRFADGNFIKALHDLGNHTEHGILLDYTTCGSHGFPGGNSFSEVNAVYSDLGTPPTYDNGSGYPSGVNTINNPIVGDGNFPPIDDTGLIVSHTYAPWTPTLLGSTVAGTATYPTNGQYGKVVETGFQTTLYFQLEVSSISGESGLIQIGGVPVRQNSTAAAGCTIEAYSGLNLDAGYTQVSAYVDAPNIKLLESGPGVGQSLIDTAKLSGSNMTFTGVCSYAKL